MVFVCPYCRVNLFDDDTSLRRHMGSCSQHPYNNYLRDYNEEASIGGLALFFGAVLFVLAGFFLWVFL